jgi:H2-forming N5,N10-methylenetetrahydromethanopterin dehydrogenase-like enzyme
MPRDEKESPPNGAPHSQNRFEPGGELGPIEDRNKYEKRIAGLPPEQKELAEETTRLADLCQYFSREQIDIPAELVERIADLSTLPAAVRIRTLLDLNRALMEYLNHIGRDSGLRQ